MKGFKRGEKGFTLVELLIVVAILGILAAVVIPNVVGLLGRGGKQAFLTDEQTIQLAAATFFADIHDGFGDINSDNADPWAVVNFTDNVWGDTVGNDTTLTQPGHFYPTAIGAVSNHKLSLSTDPLLNDPDQKSNPVILGPTGIEALTSEIQVHSIWMGLLVNGAGQGDDNNADGTTDRWNVSPLDPENALYLNEMPKSAMATTDYNGAPGTGKSGGYAWVVGENGRTFGAYLRAADGHWYQGFSGAYP